MLNKLLFKNQDKKQLVIAMIGAFLGIAFLIISIHYLIKVNQFGEGAEILGPNTVIVQKKVSNSNTLGLSRTDFSESEIQKIKDKKYVADVKPVISNNFKVSFETSDPLVPRFRTDVFIQTVDPEFLDVKIPNWSWEEDDEYVPIIMPRDFVVMLNTFMSATDIKQISDDGVMSIKCKFMISNDKREKEYVDCRVVGFTNEVSAMLVPQNFMEYGNSRYSDGTDQKITQIMIQGREGKFGEVEQLLNARGLESKNSQVVVGRLKSIVGTLVFIVLCISVIAVFVSGLVLIQFMQLLMTRNAVEVRTLMRIGYHPKIIIKKFFFYFLKVFGVVAILGSITFFITKYFLDETFISGGIYIDTALSIWSFVALLAAYLIFSLASYFSAKKGIFNEY